MKDHDCGGSAVYSDSDAIRAAFTTNLIDWETRRHPTIPLRARVAPQRIGDIRLISFCGTPLGGTRGAAEISRDENSFIGILFQRGGSTCCQEADRRAIVAPGDIAIWHSGRPLNFEMPDNFNKVCMVVPVARFESVLPNAESYNGLHLKAETRLASLLGAYLGSLADNTAHEDEPCGDVSAMDVTLELLSATMIASRRPHRDGSRSSLFERIIRFIDHRLDDPALSPALVASANGISIRYLYLLFGEQEQTVSGWIRSRRLARCRAELGDTKNQSSITEIAYKWGFSDSAHFSRLFKSAYGMSPRAFRSGSSAGVGWAERERVSIRS